MADDLDKQLRDAALNGNLKKVRALLAEGADINGHSRGDPNTALLFAFMEGHREVWRHLLDAGADVHAKDETGETAMHVAARAGDVEALEALSNLGLPVEARDQFGRTPLMGATGEAIEWLLKHGADPNATDKDGCTVLHEVCLYGDLDEEGEAVFALLENYGADPNIKDVLGRTPRDFLKQV